MTTTSRTPYLRATVLGAGRNADLVLPADQPVAHLVPQLLDVLRESVPVGRVELVTETGRTLDPEQPLRDAGLRDGVRLRVVASHEVPPAPAVYDMVDAVESATPRGAWTEQGRAGALALVGSALLAAGAALAASAVERTAATMLLGVVALLACAGATVVAPSRVRAVAWTLTGLGLVCAAAAVALLDAEPVWRCAAAVGAALVVTCAVGACARRILIGLTGAGALVLLSGMAAVTWLLTGSALETGAVTSVAALLLLGLLPRLALAQSGVFGVDTQVTRGELVLERAAHARVAEAHWMLLGGVVLTSAVLAVSTGTSARSSDLQPWPTALTLLVSLAYALRGRHFPLTAERTAVWVAAGVGPVALMVAAVDDRPSWAWALAALLALAGIGVLTASVVHLADHLAAQLRRTASRVESVTVLVAVPVLVGVFGVYADLLSSFE
ncbi:type VII secretion integral membrane protein EccD [Luteipulveratus sp. YIM 133132]|uniref:type VII secretion integral membrane protein EccD n=1 Tax=Luteipulveratus flavus TaxID=3031728 RepID=UPI0023B18191|nr:type VII secretion integral membrane protein EccD [Luteipulveratus sp. YIM 133132]MDE9367034.1 type VII secretion integral membrane protein EccD [Luteipulveratus sp. YIM 133132]